MRKSSSFLLIIEHALSFMKVFNYHYISYFMFASFSSKYIYYYFPHFYFYNEEIKARRNWISYLRLCHTWKSRPQNKSQGSNAELNSLSLVQLFATPWTVARQAPLSMGFSRQEYWSGLPFPSPGDLPNPGIKPGSPAWQADALSSEPPGNSTL